MIGATLHDEVLMPRTLDEVLRLAQVLAKSRALPEGVNSPETAAAIILMGRELGIPPMQALRGIHLVKGNPTLSAKLMGALIFRAGHSYTVDESTEKSCTITFKRFTGSTYTHTFTLKDAETAGLLGRGMWKQYPRTMLFSRCLSAGAGVAMPDIIAGMYTLEELADPETLVMDAETGEPIPPAVEETPEADNRPLADIPRPWDAETTVRALRMKAERGASTPASVPMAKSVARNLKDLFSNRPEEVREKMRYALMDYVFGVTSAKDLTGGQASALIAWSTTGAPDWLPQEEAISEAAIIIKAIDGADGQMGLEMEEEGQDE